MKKFNHILLILVLNVMLASRAFAGPPYLTDDPEPTDYKHWENYFFATGDHAQGGYVINGPAVELNYGAFPDTQVSLSASLISVGGNTPHDSGFGDVEFGVKYRFIHETNWWPQVAVYPAITVPTGDNTHGLGNGRALFQFPLWAQKSWGAWTTYGGGGATLNSAPGRRDFGFAGWLLQYQFGERLSLAGEAYAQGRDADDDRGFLALNFGGIYKINEHFSLLASAGHSVVGQSHLLWYGALNWNF